MIKIDVFFIPKSIGGRTTNAKSEIYYPNLIFDFKGEIFDLYNKGLNKFVFDQNDEKDMSKILRNIDGLFFSENKEIAIGEFVDCKVLCIDYSGLRELLIKNKKILIREGRFIVGYGYFQGFEKSK